jgi:hypothetical protein
MRCDLRRLAQEREFKFASGLFAMSFGDAQLAKTDTRESIHPVEPDGLPVSDIRFRTAALRAERLAQRDPRGALQR